MIDARASQVLARLDRLPATRHIWMLVLLLSLGGCFEFYDLFMTAYISPGLIAAHVFSADRTGLFGLSDQACFAASNFAGLFVGTIAFSQITDKLGRKPVFTYALIWYTASTVIMGFQSTAISIDLWRFIAGMGIGVELITIDTYLAELVPKAVRGRAFAINQFIQFSAVPMVALCCWLLLGKTYAGVAGWRIVIMLGSIGAVLVFFIQKRIPESPRWLILQGRIDQAEAITLDLERRIEADLGHPLPPAGEHITEEETRSTFSELFRPPYRRRTIMLTVFNFFQTIGFYGFGNWVPSLLASQGSSVLHSLQYSSVPPSQTVLSASRRSSRHLLGQPSLASCLYASRHLRPSLALVWRSLYPTTYCLTPTMRIRLSYSLLESVRVQSGLSIRGVACRPS
jgi:putative MFS transporter